MLNISDKLRLITEGYSIEDINAGNFTATDLIAEDAISETSLFFEAVSIDLDFMCETSTEYLTEASAWDTLKDKVVKIVNWFIQKIQNIVKWIKEKFSKKDKMEQVVESVKAKEKSGELKDKIEAHESGDAEKVKLVHLKHNDESKPAETPASKPAEPAAEEPKAKAASIAPNTPKHELRARLNIQIFEKILKGTIEPISKYSEKVSKAGDTALQNFFRNEAVLKGITSDTEATSNDDIVAALMKLVTGGGATKVDQFREFYGGKRTSYHLAIADTSKLLAAYEVLKGQGEPLNEMYKEFLDKLDKWKTQSIKIIDGARKESAINRNKDVDMQKVQRNITQMSALYAGITRILNSFSWVAAEALVDCETALKQIDSL